MNFYRVRLTPSLSVALALALALSPSLSWYAYADDPSQGQETENERPEERGAVGSGDEPREVAEEPEVDGEAGEGAAEGEAAPPSFSEVPSGAGSGSGGSAGSVVDGSSEDAYSGGAGLLGLALSDADSSELGGSNASCDAVLSDNDSDSLGSDSSRIEEEVLSGSVTRAASAFDTMLNAAISQLGFEFGSDLWSALTGKTSTDLARANLLMVADSRLILYKQLPTISSRLLDIYSHARLISSNTSSASSSLNSLLSLLKKQWGYGYGGTVVLESNSPAAWLQNIRDRMTTSRSVVGLSDRDRTSANLLAVVADTMRRQWGYGYGGTVVLESNSPAGWLKRIDINADAIFTRAGTIINSLSSVNSRLDNIFVRLASVVDYESRINTNTAYVVDNVKLVNGNLDGIFLRLATVVDYETRINSNIALVVDALNLLADYSVADSRLLSKGFSDLLQKLDGLTVEADVSVDFSGIESRLDAIRNLLVAAGLIENGKDLLNVIFGDLSGIGQAAATGAIQSAMESSFPFCIPALVKQVFGLLVFEGSAPVWEFDICGNPLVCDFSDFQLVADCTSWLSRLGLVLALLVNTRKFVFTVNGGGAS